jgi:hypothetical protein
MPILRHLDAHAEGLGLDRQMHGQSRNCLDTGRTLNSGYSVLRGVL